MGKERTLTPFQEATHLPNIGITSMHSAIFSQTWVRRTLDGSTYPFLDFKELKETFQTTT